MMTTRGEGRGENKNKNKKNIVSQIASIPVLLDVESPVPRQVNVLVVINKLALGAVVAASHHARGSLPPPPPQKKS